MSMTVMVHAAGSPVAKMANEATTWLHFPTECGGYVAIFMPMHVAEAMVAAFNGASVCNLDALIGFVEEVRDHKPTIHSGRHKSGDPAWDEDDLMPLDEFEVFQADAEALVGKKRKVAP
jgi:hypothetical protein